MWAGFPRNNINKRYPFLPSVGTINKHRCSSTIFSLILPPLCFASLLANEPKLTLLTLPIGVKACGKQTPVSAGASTHLLHKSRMEGKRVMNVGESRQDNSHLLAALSNFGSSVPSRQGQTHGNF